MVAQGPYQLVQTPNTSPVLQLAHTFDSQCIIKSQDTKEFYVTQSRAGTSGLTDPHTGTNIGNVVISRCNSSGSLIDSMTLQDAGHGLSFAVVKESGNIMIYVNYYYPNSSGRHYDIVKFKYAAGTHKRSDTSLVVMGLITFEGVVVV